MLSCHLVGWCSVQCFKNDWIIFFIYANVYILTLQATFLCCEITEKTFAVRRFLRHNCAAMMSSKFSQILQQAWPFFGIYMDKLLKENIQNSIRQSSPHLKTFTFTKAHFGQKVKRTAFSDMAKIRLALILKTLCIHSLRHWWICFWILVLGYFSFLRICQTNMHLVVFQAPTVTGVRVYTHEVDIREVILDFNIA